MSKITKIDDFDLFSKATKLDVVNIYRRSEDYSLTAELTDIPVDTVKVIIANYKSMQAVDLLEYNAQLAKFRSGQVIGK